MATRTPGRLSRMIHKAMILAAGEGKRMMPLTSEIPKVLLPVGDIPVIVHIINWLKNCGISEIGINLWHLADKIMNYLGDGSRFNVNIHYSRESSILGTAGGVKKMQDFFPETFVVVYGDVLTNFDLSSMIDFHFSRKGIATIALVSAFSRKDVGLVQLDSNQRAVAFIEKPSTGISNEAMSNAGIYVIEPEVLAYIPDNKYYDFAYDVFPALIQKNKSVYGFRLQSSDYLIDMGSIDKYNLANEDYRSGKVSIPHGQ